MELNKAISPAVCLALLMSVLFPGSVLACKARIYPPSFPLEELKEYNHVYVVQVDKVNLTRPLEESWYAPPFDFEGRVVEALKGPRKPGDLIQGVTSAEEAHARCPIFLEVGKVYLLMMLGEEMPYLLPRYGSLYVRSSDTKFNRYVADIHRANEKQHKK